MPGAPPTPPTDHAAFPTYLIPSDATNASPDSAPAAPPAGAPLSARLIDLPPQHATPDTGAAPADDALWRSLVHLNPRLHDAPILRVLHFHHAQSCFDLALSSYRAFALQEDRLRRHAPASSQHHPLDPSLVWLLGVKGFIIANDRRNAPHLLIARRSPHTRIYGGLWESAPAGGVQPSSLPSSHAAHPPSPLAHSPFDRTPFDLTPLLAATLRDEAREELGLDLTAITPHPVVVVQDSIARSFDVFLRVDLTAPIDPRRPPPPVCFTSADRWEYLDAAWLSRDDAPAFARTGTLSPPTLAALRALGWLG